MGLAVSRLGAAARRLRLPFAARLGLALTVALAASAGVTYLLMHHRLRRDAIRSDARVVRADARTFEALSQGAGRGAELPEIAAILRAVASRPGVKEAKLIDSDYRVVASGDSGSTGDRDKDAGIVAALVHGRSYAGGETDPDAPAADLEYLEPVVLRGRSYVYEVTRGADDLHAQLASSNRTQWEAFLLSLGLGLLLFVPLGGRLVREHHEALEHATLDGLTRLQNNRAFIEDLQAAIARARRHGEDLAVIALDVDAFKFINDRHGHHKGDAVLRTVARVLADGRAGDRAYRIGGDEFAVILPGTGEDGGRTVAEKAVARLLKGDVHVSAGVAELRVSGDHEALRQQADAALYEAKRRGGTGTVGFEEIADDTLVTSAEAALALDSVLALGDVETVFQPIWDFAEGRLMAVEALTRVPQSYGFAGPAELFDVAERAGRLHDLDVLCATRALAAAGRVLPDDVLLFINLAPQTLDRNASGDDWLLAAVEAAGLTLDRVVIEVTERVGARAAAVAAAIERLRERGLKVAIDDVASGNSGLEMLRRTHPDFVKIDRSIVTSAETDKSARAVLLAVAIFANQTDAYVIAEGIEDDEVLRAVTTIGERLGDRVCIDAGQGYGLGRPSPEMPAAQLVTS